MMDRQHHLTGLPILTVNLKYTLSHQQAEDDLWHSLVVSGALLGGIQEAGPPDRQTLMDDERFNGYGYFREPGRVKGQNPIFWDKGALDFLHGRVVNIAPTRSFPLMGRRVTAVPATIGRFRHRRTDRLIHLLNTHTPPGLESGPFTKERLATQKECLTHINRWVRKIPSNEAVVVIGDFNWDAAKDGPKNTPENRLTSLISQYEANGLSGVGGSHGKRDIDYIFIRRHCKYHRHVSSGLVKGLASDHNGAYARTFIL